MIDERRAFERSFELFAPPDASFEHLARRRDRKRRNQRIGSAIVAIVVALALVGGVVRLLGVNQQVPASLIDSADVGQLTISWTGHVDPAVRVEQIQQADGYVFAAAMDADTFGRWSVWAFSADCAAHGGTCDPLWHASLGSAGDEQMLTFTNGMLFTGGDDLYAFRPDCRADGGTCKPTWVGRTVGDVDGLLASDDLVFASASTNGTSGRVYAFPSSCRALCRPSWLSESIAPGTGDVGRPLIPSAVSDGVLYAAPIGGPVVGSSLDMADVYTFPAQCRDDGGVCTDVHVSHIAGERYVSRPAVADGTVYVGTTTTDTEDQGSIRAYDASCGFSDRCLEWSAVTPFALNRAQPVVVDGGVVVASRFHSTVQEYPEDCAGSCAPLWSAFGDSAALTADVAFVTSGDLGEVSAIARTCSTGTNPCDPAWRGDVPTSGKGSVGLAVSPTSLFVGGDGAVLAYAVDASAEPAGGTGHASNSLTVEVIVLAALAGAVAVVAWRRSRPGSRR